MPLAKVITVALRFVIFAVTLFDTVAATVTVCPRMNPSVSHDPAERVHVLPAAAKVRVPVPL